MFFKNLRSSTPGASSPLKILILLWALDLTQSNSTEEGHLYKKI